MPTIPGLSMFFNASEKDSTTYKAGNAGHSKECHFIFSKQSPLTIARDNNTQQLTLSAWNSSILP